MSSLGSGLSFTNLSPVPASFAFSDDGGVDSERTFIKQLVQKYVSDGSSEDLFNEDEIEESNNIGA